MKCVHLCFTLYFYNPSFDPCQTVVLFMLGNLDTLGRINSFKKVARRDNKTKRDIKWSLQHVHFLYHKIHIVQNFLHTWVYWQPLVDFQDESPWWQCSWYVRQDLGTCSWPVYFSLVLMKVLVYASFLLHYRAALALYTSFADGPVTAWNLCWWVK